MSSRIIKNYTLQDYVINDLGDLVVPANGAVDVGGDEQRLIQLSSSENLLSLMSMGIDKIQLNNGSRDLSLTEGFDLIRKVQKNPDIDAMGRWIMRVESRRHNWDTCFAGAGDDVANKKEGEGPPFVFDFSAEENDSRWVSNPPTGCKQQSVKWNFYDPVYVKGGKVYYHNIPRGSYIDFYVAVSQGYPYDIKTTNQNFDVSRTIKVCEVSYLRFAHWVVKNYMEGSVQPYDSLSAEAASEIPAYPFHIFEAVVTVPEIDGWQIAHGHWSLEFYRPRTMFFE